jgi:hypothetical protein
MKLSAKPIKNYQTNNSFDYASEWSIMQAESNDLYFQLIDLDQDSLRYMPSSATLQVIFPAVNSANILTLNATQANAADSSIWKVSLTSAQIPSTGNVQFAMTEAGAIKRFVLQQAIVVNSLNQGGC